MPATADARPTYTTFGVSRDEDGITCHIETRERVTIAGVPQYLQRSFDVACDGTVDFDDTAWTTPQDEDWAAVAVTLPSP